jgi:protein involved in ribonucleotide reduction
MEVLDTQTDVNSRLEYESARAIRNLVFDESLNKRNYEIAPTLTAYWQDSDNPRYKLDVAKAIFKIGDVDSVNTLINNFDNTSLSTEDVNTLTNSLKFLRNEEATASLVEKFNSGTGSTAFNEAYLNALPLISNETAIKALYDHAATLSANDVNEVVSSFTTVKQRNPNAEGSVKDKLYENKTPFTSREVKERIENLFKTSKEENAK